MHDLRKSPVYRLPYALIGILGFRMCILGLFYGCSQLSARWTTMKTAQSITFDTETAEDYATDAIAPRNHHYYHQPHMQIFRVAPNNLSTRTVSQPLLSFRIPKSTSHRDVKLVHRRSKPAFDFSLEASPRELLEGGVCV